MSTGYEGQVETHKHTFQVADLGDFDLDEDRSITSSIGYTLKNAGIDEYFYEMMGTWMEDIIVPDGNDYIYWVDNDDKFPAEELFFINSEINNL